VLGSLAVGKGDELRDLRRIGGFEGVERDC
jgi:hypothetical protein